MPSLTINGKTVEVDAEPDTPLLWVLRDQLGLVGTKYGCGIAQCGACTVHVDGVATRSCQLPVEGAVGSEIVTIEGLGGPVGDAVRTAWQQLEVVQCGYCQSGQIMAAAALLAENRKPSDGDIDAGMTNICRCATYQRIRAGVHHAAKLLEA
jgi:isoquinoline 1-oxidoreductase alpha subunit